LTFIHLTERIEKWDISTTIGDIFLHHTDFLSRYRYGRTRARSTCGNALDLIGVLAFPETGRSWRATTRRW
jgi:hypothetical protein